MPRRFVRSWTNGAALRTDGAAGGASAGAGGGGAAGGSTTNPVTYDVGTCRAQPQTFCHSLWSSFGSGGQYACYATMEDCAREQNGLMGSISQQTACAPMD